MNANIKGTRRLAFLLSFTLTGGAGLLGATNAAAGDITACGQAIDSSTTNGVLKNNITYNGSASCLEVKNGRNLNLNGYTITCQTGYSCGQAVTCPTTDGLNVGSLIQSTIGNDGGHTDITGGFAVGVKNCGSVKNLKIVGATTGILFNDAGTNGQDFTGNVIAPSTTGTGIDVQIADAGDMISDNLITGGNVGIFLRLGRSVALGSQVKENILRGYGIAGIQSTITSNDYFRIERNSIIEGGAGSVPFDIAGSHPTYDDNVCEDEGPSPASPPRCECEMDRMTATTAGGCPL